MAGSLTDYGEALALNMLFRNTGPMPAAVYLGLATAAITETSTLASIQEENDANYSRKQITFSAPSQVADAATIKNSTDIAFSAWAANADLPITYGFITDAASGTTGNILAYFSLDAPKQPMAGETLTVPAQNLSVGLS